MRVEIDHRCGRVHHSLQAVAACEWPDAGYVIGDGSHALIAHCGFDTVTLYTSRPDAERHLAELDTAGCGRECEGNHELVTIDLTGHVADHRTGVVSRLRRLVSI